MRNLYSILINSGHQNILHWILNNNLCVSYDILLQKQIEKKQAKISFCSSLTEVNYQGRRNALSTIAMETDTMSTSQVILSSNLQQVIPFVLLLLGYFKF